MAEKLLRPETTPDRLRPGRLCSLWDIMNGFNAAQFFRVCITTTTWAKLHSGDATLVPKDFGERHADLVKGYDDFFISLGLSASRKTFQRLGEEFEKEGCRWSQIAAHAEEFIGRFVDETDEKQFFTLTPHELFVFEKPLRGWETGIERFPTILTDVEEASKCWAFSRYPAAVFHSVQIVESALIELGKFLKVTDPRSGWTAVTNALLKVLKKDHKDLSAFERRHRAFLEQMHGTVEGLKNAWRNKISHSEGRLVLMTTEFSPEVSEEILLATRAFVRRLGEGIPAPKPKKKKRKKRPPHPPKSIARAGILK